jgi:hypothetical protein
MLTSPIVGCPLTAYCEAFTTRENFEPAVEPANNVSSASLAP